MSLPADPAISASLAAAWLAAAAGYRRLAGASPAARVAVWRERHAECLAAARSARLAAPRAWEA